MNLNRLNQDIKQTVSTADGYPLTPQTNLQDLASLRSTHRHDTDLNPLSQEWVKGAGN